MGNAILILLYAIFFLVELINLKNSPIRQPSLCLLEIDKCDDRKPTKSRICVIKKSINVFTKIKFPIIIYLIMPGL
ncbi:MAG: hypothetical protein A2220_05725 [Ignavibacteria bacterium RIFOXYA2_FULL_35_10]|nr:MAG: hypothetical protein A2220_05725 [Ignavibacteria bacterium RIFOXYA2_FULL_35_10]